MTSPKYSIVVPVYNRPDEINELLESLTLQSYLNFEVVVVEDGSQVRCDKVVDLYRDKIKIQYFYKPNSGPGPSRNFGFTQALGDYFIVFDSDCIIPSTYLASVEEALKVHYWDAWGGPDKAHENFTTLQRAMGYTMSSVLTTGGIRGAKRMVGKFQPRSFNMGLSRQVFEKTGGFKFTHFAEDIELSIRMQKDGFKIGLVPDAFVFHKRRTDFGQFYHQVFNFGRGRVLVGRMHPQEIKATHWFPSLFLMGVLTMLILPFINSLLFSIGVSLFFIYLLAIFIHAFIETHSLQVALLSVPSALIQLGGYGIGFLSEKVKKQE